MNQICFNSHVDQWARGMGFSVHLLNHKINIKFCKVLGLSIARHQARNLFASAVTSKVDRKHKNNEFASSDRGSDGFQRSRIASGNLLESTTELEKELQELLDEIMILIRMGENSEAVVLLQANYEVVKEKMDAGARGLDEAAILDVICLGYMALGDLRAVETLLNELNKVVEGLNENEPLLHSIRLHMGSMYEKLDNIEMSLCLYKRALEGLKRTYGNSDSFLVPPLLGMAKALGSLGKARDAIEVYHRVIRILESSRGAESEELVVPLSSLGNLLMKEGRVEDAEITFSRILNTYAKSYGKKDGRVGLAMSCLARVECAKGNVDKAIDLYEKALQIIEDSSYMSLDDSAMEKMRVELAELLHVAGRGGEGRAVLEECLLITQKYKGKEHPGSVTHLVNLATSYSSSKDFAEAERLLKMSLQVMRKTMAPEDPSITFPMLHLAVTLYNLNRDAEAEKYALEALRIREEAFGKESLPVGEALDCLVSIQTRLEKDGRELLDLLKRVLKIQEKAFGHDGEEVMETLKKIIYCLDRMGMKHEKLPLQRRLSNVRQRYKQTVRHY